MKRLLTVLALSAILLSGAETRKTVAQCQALLADNVTGAISPQDIRDCLIASALLLPANAQTGTTYTVVALDRGKNVTHTNAAAIAVTLPQATSSFGDGWFYYTKNLGAGAVTITPTTSAVGGAATLELTTDQWALIVSDGVNYNVYGSSVANPAGSGSEVNYRSDATTFGAVTNSSVSGGSVIWKAVQTVTMDAIGSTSTNALKLDNTTAATTSQQQWSPSVILEGRGWDAVGTPQSRWSRIVLENRPQRSMAELGGAGSQNNGMIGFAISAQVEGSSAIDFFHMTHDPDTAPTGDSQISNMFMGFGAGGSVSGQAYNLIGIGTNALATNTSGRENACIGNGCMYLNTTGIWNNCIGIECLSRNTTGDFNVALGQDAGGGSQSREGNTTGNYNVYLGVSTQPATYRERNSTIVIGHDARVDQSNVGVLGKSGIKWTAGGLTKTLNTFEVVDPSTLAGETLSETDFATSNDWTPSGDWAITGGQAVWTHSAGWGYLTQLEADFAITPAIGARWYKFSYDVVSYSGNGSCGIGGNFGELEGGAAVPLQLEAYNYPKTQTIYIRAIGNPTEFLLDCSSSSGAFTLDNVTLKEVTGGDFLVNNDLKVDGQLHSYNQQSTVGLGQPYTLGNISTTGLTAAVSTANIVASAAAGLYRVSGYMQTTTQAAGVCTSDVTIGWTYNSAAKTEEVVSNHDQAVDETYSQIPPTIVRVDAAANLTYAISLDAGGDCSNAVFDAYLVAERMQ